MKIWLPIAGLVDDEGDPCKPCGWDAGARNGPCSPVGCCCWEAYSYGLFFLAVAVAGAMTHLDELPRA